MKYEVTVTVEVLATSAADAEQKVFEFVNQAVFAHRKIYSVVSFDTKDVKEVYNS